jgi:hypothetical protein
MTQAIGRSMRRRWLAPGALAGLLMLSGTGSTALAQSGEVILSDQLSGSTYDLVLSIKQTGATAWKLGVASFVVTYDPLALRFETELEEGNWDDNKFPGSYGDQFSARYTLSGARSVEVDFTGVNGSGVFLSLLPTVLGKLRFTVLDPVRGFMVRWDQQATVVYDDQGVDRTSSVLLGLATAIGEEPWEIPSAFELQQNYPNPFNPATTIRYGVPYESHVTLAVYNLVGEHLATLVDEPQAPGYHAVTFNAERFSSGFYIYRITAAGTTLSRKMLLVK